MNDSLEIPKTPFLLQYKQLPLQSNEDFKAGEACLEDFAVFLEQIFGFDLAQHHFEWVAILQEHAQQLEDGTILYNKDFIKKWNQIMLMAPRNHGKTTIFSVAYVLWLIARNQNIRIILVSNTSTQARSFLRQVTTNLEQNELYVRYFGNLIPQMPDKWTQDEIIVSRSDMTLKDPTVSAVGTGGSILSRRADVIICDDILNKQNTKTAIQRDQTREWFFEVLKPVLDPIWGKMIVIGTAWNSEDLYHRLMGTGTYDIRVRFDAIVDVARKITLWPERWSYDKLMLEKQEAGTLSFNKSYRNLVQSAEDAVFKLPWIEAAKDRGKKRRLIQHLNYAEWDLGYMVTAEGVDLAISKREGSDDTAFAVIGRTRNGMKIPLHLSKHHGFSMKQTEDMIMSLQERFQPGIILVENNGYQAAIQRDLADRTDLPIKGYQTGGEKYDETVGLNSLAVEFENDKWILPYDVEDPITQTIVDELVDAMLAFPNGHTADILMALWFANTGMRQLVSKPQGHIRQESGSFWNNNR